jgi:hypothetical protein
MAHPLLRVWSKLTDELDMGTAVTLIVGGLVVSGHMISARRYTSSLGSQLEERFKRSDRPDLAESFRQQVAEEVKLASEKGERYVYLQDARIGVLSFPYLAFNLEVVDGFAF